jgi:hypothetical protein
MESTAFGRRANMHTYVGGWLIRNQDWGNYLFGWTVKQLGFNMWEIRNGADIAQILKGKSSWGFWNSHFDDPIDQFWIQEGYYNSLMLPFK